MSKKVPQGHVYGIDPSDAMIDQATKVFSDHSNLTFKKTSAGLLLEVFGAEPMFDVMVSFSCLHWVQPPEMEQFLHAVSKLLKPGGDVCFFFVGATRNQPDPGLLRKTIEDTAQSDKWKALEKKTTGLRRYLLEEIQEIMEKAGVSDVLTARVEPTETIFKSEEDLAVWLAAWLPGDFAFHSREECQEFSKDVARQHASNQAYVLIYIWIVQELQVKG
eukprot:Colp12_sorted_trinity150504_noHs@30951